MFESRKKDDSCRYFTLILPGVIGTTVTPVNPYLLPVTPENIIKITIKFYDKEMFILRIYWNLTDLNSM